MDLVNRTPQFEKEINKIFEGGDLKNSQDNDGSLLGIKNLEGAVALYDFMGQRVSIRITVERRLELQTRITSANIEQRKRVELVVWDNSTR